MANAPRVEADRPEEKLHFLDYWRVVKKRKEIIVATLVIIVSTVFVLSLITKPTFSASSQVKIEQRQRPMEVFGSERTSYIPFDQWEFETHIKALEGDTVLAKVINGEIYGKDYNWYCETHSDRLFNDRQAKELGDVCPVCSADLKPIRTKKYPGWKPLTEKWAEEDGFPGRPYRLEGAIARLRGNLRIRPEKGTRLITIRYESHDKEEARLVADMVAEAYIQTRQDIQEQLLQSAVAILEREQRAKRRELNAGMAELAKKREKCPLDKLDQPIQYSRQEVFLQKKDLVRTDIAKLQASVNLLRAMTREERVHQATPENPGIYQLAAELAREEATLSALLVPYGIEHPDVMSRKEAIARLKERLYTLADGALEAKKAELAALQTQESELDKIIQGLAKQIEESQHALKEYETSRSDVDQKKKMLEKMEESRIVETTTNAIPREDILLHQRAQLPSSPVKPRKLFNVIVSIFVGLTLGTGMAYFVEYLDTSIKNVDDLERYLGMSMLGIIPKQTEGVLISDSPKSRAAENYRMLWTSLEFERREDKFKYLMITSGGASEGKTTTVVNLGIAAAQMESRVLLVDSDLRRPKIHKLLKYANNVGLSDVLLKDVNPREVIIKTEIPNLWVMPSGKLPSNVIGLLSSHKMKNIIDTLSQDFDILLFDSPPVIGVSDASVLAHVVNRVLLVIDYKKYPRGFAKRAAKTLENVGGQVVGVVINNLNIKEEGYYYYGYGRAYRYYYRRYYDEEDRERGKAAEAAKEEGVVAAAANPGAEGESEKT